MKRVKFEGFMNEKKSYDLIVVLGHTAGGKTSVAAHVAHHLGSEVISADSRQVYRGMTIGTGKDYKDYIVNEETVPVHLMDVVDAGYEYNVFEFQRDFYKAYESIRLKSMIPVLCGGSGMYIEAVLRKYNMLKVPVNEVLRKDLEGKDIEELRKILSAYKDLHNKTDIDTRKRAIRAIEIAEHIEKVGKTAPDLPDINALVTGIRYSREERRSRITERLRERLEEGMVEEAQKLVEEGISLDKLEYYGLEYKFLARYLRGDLTYQQMFEGLNTAIHQFAKRQMTYFRGMEKRGIPINWIDGKQPLKTKVQQILDLLSSI